MNIFAFGILAFLLFSGNTFLTDSLEDPSWNIENNSEGISWAKFEWTGENLNGKYFDKTAMLIPCKIPGLKNPVTFQFDLGSDVTGIYENTLRDILPQNPELTSQMKTRRNKLRFWKSRPVFESLVMQFGNYKASQKTAYVFEKYGEKPGIKSPGDTVHLGTIGRDLFHNKVLIIDYPNQQFAICEKIPAEYQKHLVDIEIDKYGRIILPMTLKGNKYRILFDTGSSIFPLITKAEQISTFSNSPDVDSLWISSWGKTHQVTAKIITDTFVIAGQSYSNVKVYANHSGLGIDNETDGMTGNALFWDRKIVIDFKNKKFGIH